MKSQEELEKGENVKIYEALVLLNPDFGREEETALGFVTSLIEKHDGEMIRIEKYADQELAYEIKNFQRGVYILAAFRLTPGKVKDLSRSFELEEVILRNLVLEQAGGKLEQFFRHYEREETKEASRGDAERRPANMSS